jgi:transcriptional regulator with GAF, ATPase, and Fis domain
MLEERQILPLGATKVVAVDVRICSATHRDLAAEVARGRFRDDLYYRLGLPSISVPPLRQRREEIPWLMQSMVGQETDPLRLHASVVEETLLRPWPGNVRELGKRMAEAARTARAQGETSIRAIHLSPLAGRLNAPAPASGANASRPPDASSRMPDAPLSRPEIERALADAAGNVTATAVALGLHRTQLRRLMVQLGIRRPKGRGDGED